MQDCSVDAVAAKRSRAHKLNLHTAASSNFAKKSSMGDSNFFKGTSADQDRRFKDKESKLLKTLKFPQEFDTKVLLFGPHSHTELIHAHRSILGK